MALTVGHFGEKKTQYNVQFDIQNDHFNTNQAKYVGKYS